MHSSDPEHPNASLASSLFPSLYILAIIWAAAAQDISKCDVELGVDAVVLGVFGLGDGDDGRPREGSATLPWPSRPSAGEHCVAGPQHVCHVLASATMASVSNAGAEAPFGTSRSGRDEPDLFGGSGSVPALFVCGAGREAVVGRLPDVWSSNIAR